MPTRIDRRIAALAQENRAALVTFVIAGDRDLATSREVLSVLRHTSRAVRIHRA